MLPGSCFWKSAGLHAVVADAVTGPGNIGLLDDDHGQGCQGVAFLAQHVHLADPFAEGATLERDPEGVALGAPVLLQQAARAGVLASLVAIEAIVHLGQNLARGHAPVGELKTDPAALVLIVGHHGLGQLRTWPPQRHQVGVVELVGQPKRDPARHPVPGRRFVVVHRCPALEAIEQAADQGEIVRGIGLLPGGQLVQALQALRRGAGAGKPRLQVEQGADRSPDLQLAVETTAAIADRRGTPERGDGRLQSRVESGRVLGGEDYRDRIS